MTKKYNKEETSVSSFFLRQGGFSFSRAVI